MTNNEIKDVLHQANTMVNSMDKAHAKKLLSILMNAQAKKSSAFFAFMDIKKTVRKLLSDLIKSDHVNNYLGRKDMKQIYEIIGDYGIYPICKLCGKPIKIDTYIAQHQGQSNNMMFSWDHIKPKSMGGSYDLANMQPTHKLCNNKRGRKPLYSSRYTIDVRINIMLGITEIAADNPKYRQTRFGLRKQDSWCHKDRRQHKR